MNKCASVLIAGGLFVACASTPAPKGEADLERPLTIDQQVAQGASSYRAECASCHGARGEGAGAPAVVGAKALPVDPPDGAQQRQAPFRTARDVLHFVQSSMPPGAPGSLSRDSYLAIVAHLLDASGKRPTAVLDAENADDLALLR